MSLPKPPADTSSGAALYYDAMLEYSVIPTGANKVPLIPWKPYQAVRASPDLIDAWWNSHPQAGVGIITGSISRLVVIDVDKQKDGLETLAKLVENGFLSKADLRTWRVRTPRGGVHLYYRYIGSDLTNCADLFPGIDVRGEGGFVVAPPSVTPGVGSYVWERFENPNPLPQLPQKLADKIRDRSKSKPGALPQAELSVLMTPKSEGARHDTLKRLVGHYAALGEQSVLAWQAIVWWNNTNLPPIPDSELKEQFDDMWSRWGIADQELSMEEIEAHVMEVPPAERHELLTDLIKDRRLSRSDRAKWRQRFKKLFGFPKGDFDDLVALASKAEDPEVTELPLLTPQERVEIEEVVGDLPRNPGLFHMALHAIEDSGVVGERSNLGVMRLVFRSRALVRPVNCQVYGLSSSGKTHLVTSVAAFEHSTGLYEVSAGSEKALIYLKEPLSRRVLYIQEPEGLPQGVGQAVLKSLAWENRVRYITVMVEEGARYTIEINKAGPTGLIVTTTRKLDDQISNRMLLLEVDSTTAQTVRVYHEIANSLNSSKAEGQQDVWMALSRLMGDPADVEIGFGHFLASNFSPLAMRGRRDFSQLLNLVAASAVEHQYQRTVSADGRILATLADYAVVYAVARKSFQVLQAEGITDSQRELLEAVKELSESSDGPIPSKSLVAALGMSPATISRRVEELLREGLLHNLESNKYKPKQLILAGDIPEETTSLPTPQALAKYLRDTNHGHLVQSWIDPITGAFCGITDGGGVASHPWCQRCIQAKAQPKAQAPEAPNEEKPVSYIL